MERLRPNGSTRLPGPGDIPGDALRILHVLDHSAPLLSGYTYRTLGILREQRRLGWETAQVTGPKHASIASEENAEGFLFHRTPKPSGVTADLPVLKQLAVTRALERRLEELVPVLRPDVLHAHSPALNGLAALRVGRRYEIPVLYEMRASWEDAAVDHGTSREGGIRYRLSRDLETHVFERAAAVTTICEGLANDIIARGIPAGKVTVIPNAVDVERFPAERQRDGGLAKRLGLEDSEVVGFIGSFYAYEGLDLLVEAFPSLLQKRPGVRALLVGAGPRDELLRRRVADEGLSDRVVFTGRVPFDEVRRYYDLIDVLVYPRLPMRLTETVTPLKPLEAMAMGKPLVASNVGGHRELVRDDETGLLFRAGDAAHLVEQLSRTLGDAELRAKLGCHARRFVEDERTWERAVSPYRLVYESLTGGTHV